MKKIVKGILLVFWMGVIFYFSAQPQVESANTSNVVTEMLFGILETLFKGLDRERFVMMFAQPIRKLAHFTEFMLLGILLGSFVSEFKVRSLPISLFLSIIYAVSDELHQLFVPNRYCDIRDILLDCAGAAVGVFLYHCLKRNGKKNMSDHADADLRM